MVRNINSKILIGTHPGIKDGFLSHFLLPLLNQPNIINSSKDIAIFIIVLVKIIVV